jgi:replicative DNA helicase
MKDTADTSATWRKPPHNIEAEQALLGAILVNNEAHERVSDFVEPHHFFDPLHRQMYETMSKLIASGRAADWKTLKTAFENAEPIDAGLSVVQYLGKLAANATTIINAREYGRTIHDLATRRDLILIGEDMVNAAYDSPVDFQPKEQIEEAEARLFALVERGERGQETDFSAAADAAMKGVRDAHLGKRGLSTGLKDLDGAMGRLQSTDLIILAARPGMAKSALAAAIADSIAASGTPVGFYSLEMSASQLATRMICARAGLPIDAAMRGKLDERQLQHFGEVAAKVSSLPLIIDDRGGISIAQLAARARRLKRKQGIGLLVVDYLQLMSGSAKRRGDGRVQEVTEITNGLKALAKELSIPILALSQLSRAVEAREDKRPHLADLRESGSIEQDADIVLFLYRQEYYLARERPDHGTPEFADWAKKMDAVAGKAEVIVGKHRYGASAVVHLHFDGRFTRFSNYAFSHHHQPNGAATSYSAGPIYSAMEK